MFNFAKQVGSRVLASVLVISAEQYVRTTVEGIVRDRRQAKRIKQERELSKR